MDDRLLKEIVKTVVDFPGLRVNVSLLAFGGHAVEGRIISAREYADALRETLKAIIAVPRDPQVATQVYHSISDAQDALLDLVKSEAADGDSTFVHLSDVKVDNQTAFALLRVPFDAVQAYAFRKSPSLSMGSVNA